MKEIAIMYVKIIIFIIIPLLLAVTVAAFFIAMIQNEVIRLIVSVVFAIILGFSLILYVHWIDDKFNF